ncbi:MAG: hypothetical protein DRJ47_01805 [Thermoprotei archaeon]|nr:MAG: hypothetical protein DRJ47_01805 [Thermoprotei archaeon]
MIKLVLAELRELTRFPLIDICLTATLIMVSLGMLWMIPVAEPSASQSIVDTLLKQVLFYGFNSAQIFIAFLLAITSSLSIARDYEMGKMHVLLTLPVSRKSYLLSKIISSLILSLVASAFSLAVGVIPNFYFNLGKLPSPYIQTLTAIVLLSMFYMSIFLPITLILKKTLPSILTSIAVALAIEAGSKLIGEQYGFLPTLCYSKLAYYLLGLGSLDTWVFIASILYPIPFLLAGIWYFDKRFEVGK